MKKTLRKNKNLYKECIFKVKKAFNNEFNGEIDQLEKLLLNDEKTISNSPIINYSEDEAMRSAVELSALFNK